MRILCSLRCLNKYFPKISSSAMNLQIVQFLYFPIIIMCVNGVVCATICYNDEIRRYDSILVLTHALNVELW